MEQTGEHRRSQLDRRGFLRRFKESTSVATLCERPVAVAVLYIEEIADIAQIIATKVSEQIMSTALARLPARDFDASPTRYLGQLSENLLALVVEPADRDVIESVAAGVCAKLREPVVVGDAEFCLTPYAGVSILGVDASTPRVLLDHARAAAAEARRAVSRNVFFFSDTMQLKSLERLDIARELRDAIANGDIRLRYTGRHDLRTGRLVAWIGYVRWEHPLRGDIRPAEFLRVAQTTGLAASLSRSVLAQLPSDYAALGGQMKAGVRISLGALRDHVLHEDSSRTCMVSLRTAACRQTGSSFGSRRRSSLHATLPISVRCNGSACSSSSTRWAATSALSPRWHARPCGACSSTVLGSRRSAATPSRARCAEPGSRWPRRYR